MKKNIIISLICVIGITGFAQEEISKEIIKGKYLGKIDEKKPPTELRYDIFEVVEPYGIEGSNIYDVELQVHSEISSTPLPILASNQIRRPWLGNILTLPIKISNISVEKEVKQWELVITDALGEVFRTFAGIGNPPEVLEWDGRDSKDNMIDPGRNYSYYLRVIDKENKSSFQLGKKVRVPALYWKEELKSVVRLDGRIVFEKNSAHISEAGKDLLEEAADYVRKDVDKRLRVVVYSRNENLAMERTKKIANFLLDRIILPEKAVASVIGYESVGDKRTDRIDITIR
jgi:outer membrane protein OmpA-like peptidoglycan-associated protein